jgi:hypothetical protein
MATPRWRLYADIDALLRPRAPDAEATDLELQRLLVLAVALGATYGFFMGWYAVSLHWGTGRFDGLLQLLTGMIKLPALFLCTLAVTFPSLYVFSALAGVQLSLIATLRLLVSAIVVNLAVAASLGTILAFFTLSTTSYSFMVVLNVVLLSIAGIMGLAFLRRTLAQVVATPIPSTPPPVAAEVAADETAPQSPASKSPQSDSSGGTLLIFRVWTVIYALVGMQMGWLLRPFIGHPDAGFSLFRARSGNFFLGLFENLGRILGS